MHSLEVLDGLQRSCFHSSPPECDTLV
ncbi:hypothetical protein P4O66_018736, partial [Electrophorus voltai]